MIIKDLGEGSSGTNDDFFRADNECNDVVIDLDSFWRVMGEPTDFSQGSSHVPEHIVRDEPPCRSGKLLDFVREIKENVKVENNFDWMENSLSDSNVKNGLNKRKSCEAPIKVECFVDLVTDKKPRLSSIEKEIIHIPEMEHKVPKIEPKVPKMENSVLNIIDDDDDDSDVNILEDNDGSDSDVCILEDKSSPTRPITPSLSDRKFVGALQFPTLNTPINQTGVGCSRDSKNDERVKLQEAVEDLKQPEKEANPPDGHMAVPLMKHQRIALAWMVDQETKSLCCSGGILADDQGLGKTITTIALILTERSPSSKSPTPNKVKTEVNMLNLDDDGGEYHLKDGFQGKGKPQAGTLVVCPTSVLKQWSEELVNKVTPKANLSVLVYYGTNRTKDPLELAKYDVVVTTYNLVSMEVTQEPAVNEKDDPIGTPFSGFKKKKINFKLPRVNKALDDEIRRDIKTGPLSKVAWFRVVLDETQCIKNHRTISARTCWGLRAKRRWCLSGTPIQNSIDDIYSYFRFVRHDPFSDFRTFCEQIKAPIFFTPEDGFKRLQVVLKTFLLRRTKSTLIDGKPIIIIPPKNIELIGVEFSKEERDFYVRLEVDARAQFQNFANQGTLKENFAIMLVLLLRLRQACDHTRLVNWGKFKTRFVSSAETARKLPREKQIFLLNCLEASSSICGICSDSPEDAVVTVCGHVYCYECIKHLMIGDETQCPDKDCKTNLIIALVFSKETLRGAMSNTGFDGVIIPDAESLDPRPPVFPESSSKIKATLKLLLSILKSPVSHDCDSLSLVAKKEEPEKGEPKKEEPVGEKLTEKVLVFSQWTRMLDLLEASLNDYSIQYRRLDGRMPICARDTAVKEFNSIPQVNVMLMSLKAASLGLNMVAANHVIILDLWWNPTTEDQAIDRAHRIGQTRPVSVFRLAVKETVEDRILALQEKKRMMVAAAFGEEGQGGGQSTRLTMEDLSFLFKVPLKKGKKKQSHP